MRTKVLIAIALALLASLAVGVARATPPSGLTSELLARGAAGEFRLVDRSTDFKIVAEEATDVAFVKATLTPGGHTGWHQHPSDSLVIVKSGTLTLVEPHDGRCAFHGYRAGQAFVHPGAHDFAAGPDGAEFYVAYFVPAGAAPLLTDVRVVPRACR
jgi:quercetin dioxygenase-like cupin family protein